MFYIHSDNIDHKIRDNYNGKANELSEFKRNFYLPFRAQTDNLVFDENHRGNFDIAAKMFDEYYNKVQCFSKKYKIDSRSKFESSFLEEISSYLFRDLPEIKNNTYDIFNKGIYAGIKIDTNNQIDIIKKDVDFCIGKKFKFRIDNNPQIDVIVPVVAVEVKTYLDKTMFGEVQYSSQSIRSAVPNSKTYVLMGYKELSDNNIIAARQDSALTEMFVLRDGKQKKRCPTAAYNSRCVI